MTIQVLIKRSISLLSLFLVFPAWANTVVESRIHDVDYGIQPQEDTLVLLENGRVLRIKDKEKTFPLTKRSQLKFSVDKNNYLMSVSENNFESVDESLSVEAIDYQPTVVEGLDTATKIFKDMRRAKKESECFNRAHVWSYELLTQHQISSQKMFIFFSIKYIRENDFKWWFHVAPFILVNENSRLVERVLDRTFSKAPRELAEWKSIFIGKEIQCRTVTKYSDYADYPFNNECSYMRAPMHIHQPLDLEMLEVWNTQKTEFVPADLKAAYENGFDINYNGGI